MDVTVIDARPLHVEVSTVSGDVMHFVIFVRDSSPGDICALGQWDRKDPATEFSASFDLACGSVAKTVAAATWDSIGYDGVPGFEPHANQDYWGFGYWDEPGSYGTHWCYPSDEMPGMRGDLNGGPLHLQLSYRGSPDTVISVSLDPAQASS